MDTPEGTVREGPNAQASTSCHLPETCPLCQAPTRKKTFVNGTIEVRCVQTEATDSVPAHGFTLYVKPR